MSLQENADILIKSLDKKIDLGNPEQVKLFTDMISETNQNLKIAMLLKLINNIINQNSSTNNYSNTVEQNKRLQEYLQHFFSVLQGLSSNDSNLIKFLTKNYEKYPTNPIPQSFFLTEAENIKTLLGNNDIKLEKIDINNLAIQVQNIKKIKSIVSNTSQLEEVKNYFFEICLAFETSSLLNDILIEKLNHDDLTTKSSLQYKSIKNQNKKLLEEINALQNDKTEILIENEELKNKINNIKLQNQKDITDHQYKINRIRDECKQVKEQIISDSLTLTESLNTKELTIQKLIKQKNEDKQTIKNLKEQLQQQETIQKENETIRNNFEENSKIILQMKEEINTLNSKLQKTKQNENNSSINILKDQLNEVNSKNEQLKLINQQYLSHSEILKNENETLKNEINKIKQNIKESNQKITNIQNSNLELSFNNKSLLQQLETIKSENDQSLNEIENFKSIINTQKDEISNKNQTILMLQNQINKLSTSTKYEEQINTLNMRNKSLQMQLNESNENIKQVNQQYIELSNYIKQLKSKISKYKIKINKLKEECNHSQTQFLKEQNSFLQERNSFLQSSLLKENEQLPKENYSISSIDKIDDKSISLLENEIEKENEITLKRFIIMIADALTLDVNLSDLNNEIYRILNIIRDEHIGSVLNRSSLSESVSYSMPLLPKMDEIDREINNLKQNMFGN